MLATLRAVRVLQKGHRDMEDYGSQTDLRMNRPETEKMTGHLAETKDGEWSWPSGHLMVYALRFTSDQQHTAAPGAGQI